MTYNNPKDLQKVYLNFLTIFHTRVILRFMNPHILQVAIEAVLPIRPRDYQGII